MTFSYFMFFSTSYGLRVKTTVMGVWYRRLENSRRNIRSNGRTLYYFSPVSLQLIHTDLISVDKTTCRSFIIFLKLLLLDAHTFLGV